MFEKYTEAARRAIFMARYEASQFGAGYIETEHLLLGILRMERELGKRLGLPFEKVEAIRKQVEERYAGRAKQSTSVDIPLSKEAKRALHYAKEESKQREQSHIGCEHLLWGVFQEEKSFGGLMMRESGVTAEGLAKEVDRSSPPPAAETPPRRYTSPPPPPPPPQPEMETPASVVRNLSAAARSGKLGRLIGRDREIERILHILSRRTRNNPLLVGEPGVGKTALVEGIAQRIADCDVPAILADRPIFAVDASSLVAPSRRSRAADGPERLIAELTNGPIGILCVDGLLDVAASPGWGAVEATHVLEVLSRSGIQCIGTGTPAGLRRATDTAPLLVRHFQAVRVPAPSEDVAISIVNGLNQEYEKFHGVVFGEGVIEAAVFGSGRFLAHRQLPDRALDLLDEAGARAKVRHQRLPPDELEAQKRRRQLLDQISEAFLKHDHAKAKELADQEKEEREKLLRLRTERKPAPSEYMVTTADLEEAIADRAGVEVPAVQEVLRQKKGKESQAIAQRLAGAVPVDQEAWLPFLAAYLAGCTDQDAARLADAIRSARG